MPETPRISVIRVTRPYASEDEFVDGDFQWLGRTTIILPNAPARAAGELVRFEIVLANGAPVFRGEGHAVAHHPLGGPRPPGLEVRFTRMDSRSKNVLDRVRDKRAALAQAAQAAPPAASPAPEPPREPAPPPDAVAAPIVPSSSIDALPVLRPPTDTPSERSGVHRKAPSRVVPPANRDEILDRLRTRAQRLAAAGGLRFGRR